MIARTMLVQVLRVYVFSCFLVQAAVCIPGKTEVRKNLQQDGWKVYYGKHLDEAEYAKFLLAIGTSVASANPAPVSEYLSNLIRESLVSITRAVGKAALDIGEMTLIELIKNKGSLITGNIEIQGGVATYGGDRIVNERWDSLPEGLRPPPIVVDGPNTHQPFIRWRKKPGPQPTPTETDKGNEFLPGVKELISKHGTRLVNENGVARARASAPPLQVRKSPARWLMFKSYSGYLTANQDPDRTVDWSSQITRAPQQFMPESAGAGWWYLRSAVDGWYLSVTSGGNVRTVSPESRGNWEKFQIPGYQP